jgi:hypothetical protein
VLFRRIILLSSAASLIAVTLLAGSAASAAPPAKGAVLTATFEAVPAAGPGVLSNCPITSYHLHSGAYICESVPVRVSWYLQGVLVNVDDVVIGTDYRIYHDDGGGWTWLNGGVATAFANAPGIFIQNSNTIGVVGTDNALWCTTTTLPGVWNGWRRC